MAERIVLDPTELAGSSRTELDVTPWLAADGVDWGDGEISASSAQAFRGSIPVDFTVPNRSVSAGLVFGNTLGGTTTSAARAAIGAKAALLQREGGWLKRVTNAGGTVFTEIVNASFRATSIPGWASRNDQDPSASLSLEVIPEFYEAEVTDSDNSTTSDRELIFNSTGLSGDNPARVRMVVDNDGSTDWRGLIWAYRSRHFPTDGTHSTTAKVAYGAEDLQALDTATKVALTGAHGGTVVTHGTVSTNWTPVVGTNIGGTTYLTHTGTYRLWARVYSTSGTAVQSRFVYDVGDLVNPAENPSFRLPGASNYYIQDYGEVRLDPSPVGTHRWQGQIQAKGDAGAENFSVDKLWLQNTDESAGVLSVPIDLSEGLATYSARSEFTTESGAITGDSLSVGGTWTGAGDADDFSESSDTAVRTAVSDSGASHAGGRLVTASTPTLTATVARVDFKRSANPATISMGQGLVLRYTDVSNFLVAYMTTTATVSTITIAKRVAASDTVIHTTQQFPLTGLDSYLTLTAYVDASGVYSVRLGPQGRAGASISAALGQDSALATGGALASGKVGVFDFYTSATANTRTYDNFAAWVPQADTAIFTTRNAQLSTDGIRRQDSGGTAYGELVPTGDFPRLPVPALSGGTVETLLVPSTGDLDQSPDLSMGTASISARHFRRPSWLFVDDS